MPTDLIKQLLEAGVHFGHKTSRWNPKMKRFIFGERSGIYIIDLEKVEDCLNKARDYLLDITSKGETVLFVGTKKQAQEVIQAEAVRAGMFYVTDRWPGGLLTNFATVKRSINRLKEIEKMKEDGTYEKLTKKEIARLEKELIKLNKNFSGIVQMERMPKAIFIVDTKKEETAVREAKRLGITIMGLIDTNSDPDLVDYPIPGNDDATKSIRMIATLIADSVIEGRKKFLNYLSETGAQAALKESQANAGIQPVVLPEEDVKIKEIEDQIVEILDTDDEETKNKKLRLKASAEEKARNKRKV